jgi:hypothetical protein
MRRPDAEVEGMRRHLDRFPDLVQVPGGGRFGAPGLPHHRAAAVEEHAQLIVRPSGGPAGLVLAEQQL